MILKSPATDLRVLAPVVVDRGLRVAAPAVLASPVRAAAPIRIALDTSEPADVDPVLTFDNALV